MATSFEGPERDTSALVFRVRNTTHARAALEGFAASPPAAHGLGAVDAYLRARPQATLIPLGARAHRGAMATRATPFFMPELVERTPELATVHYLHLDSPDDGPSLRETLHDDEHVEYVHHPVIQRPLLAPPGLATAAVMAAAPLPPEWGMIRCGFPQVWDDLEQGPDSRRIALIDMGSVAHEDLDGRVDTIREPARDPSTASHAMEVAGVIAAKRGDEGGVGMSGCCSARLDWFNVWSDSQGYDSHGLYAALLDIATRGESYAVLNLSLGSSVNDEAFASGIRDCVRAGVVVVAAMGDDGNGGSSPIFPAAQCEVIAVGGTDEFDNKQRSSKTGAHIWISAPSDRIRTLAENDTYEPQNGTSYAAPMVSAAVWLARHANPSLTTAQVRELLSRAVASAAVPPVRDPQLGFGRLDMVKLAQLVREKP